MTAAKPDTDHKPDTDDKEGASFSDAEKAAMKERAAELKAQRSKGRSKKDPEADVLAKIAEMGEPYRSMATRIHEIVKEVAPQLTPKTMYGMPGYAKGTKVMCFFQSADKWNTPYSTFSFQDNANIADGPIFPVSFGITEWTPEVEAKITALIVQAASE